MNTAQIKGRAVSLYQASKELNEEFWIYFYDYRKGTCYGFMVRQLTYYETSYGQSILRAMENIYNIFQRLLRKNQ